MALWACKEIKKAARSLPLPDRGGRIVGELRIRAATGADVPAIANTVEQAYRHYIARIGKPPGPMLDDYGATHAHLEANRCL
jgi:hypothetical protein